jgi:hypothetical protein
MSSQYKVFVSRRIFSSKTNKLGNPFVRVLETSYQKCHRKNKNYSSSLSIAIQTIYYSWQNFPTSELEPLILNNCSTQLQHFLTNEHE